MSPIEPTSSRLDVVSGVDVDVYGAEGMPCRQASDAVAVEAPVEIRIDGAPFAVVMRTPGDDEALALGFLLTEGVLVEPTEVTAVVVDPERTWVDVQIAEGRGARLRDLETRRRRVATSSSCGMCGRASMDGVRIALPQVASRWRVTPALIATLPAMLRQAQPAFAATGGLHAAALVDRETGQLLDSAEDVGRHNAVDKLLGRAWHAGRLPLSNAVLVVSGRTSFEILQKAWYGGLPLVAAVSAPSSLAIEVAREAGITLLGFVRDRRFNVYAHPQRIDGGP